MESNAYVVTSGEYSDYRICAVFSDKELAEAFAAAYGKAEFDPNTDDYGGIRVEEHPVDPVHADEIVRGYEQFRVNISRHGDVKTVGLVTCGLSMVGKWHGIWDGGDLQGLIVVARDERHAIKIACEQRLIALADGSWDRRARQYRGQPEAAPA